MSDWRSRAKPVQETAPPADWRSRAKPVEQHGALKTAAAHGANQLVGGFGDEIAAGWQANLADAKRALSGDLAGAVRSQVGGLKDLVGMGEEPTLSDVVRGEDGSGEWLQRFRSNRQENRAALDEMARQNPKSAIAGGVAGGLVGSLAMPGGAVAQGALSGLGNSEADLTRGDVGGALRDAAIGGVAGKAGQLLGKGAGRLASGVASRIRGAPQALREMAEESAAKVGNPMLKGYRLQGEDGIREMGRELLDSGAVRAFDNVDDVAKRLPGIRQEAGAEVGRLAKVLDRRDASVFVDDLADEMEAQILAPLQRFPGQRGVARRVADEIAAIRSWGAGKKLGFEEAEALKRSLDDAARNFSAVTPTAEVAAMERLRGLAGSFNDDIARQADPRVAEQFFRAKEKFGNLAPADQFVQDFALRQAANRNINPSTYLAAAGGNAGGSSAQGIALGLLNHMGLRYGRSTLAVGADNLAKLLAKGGTQAKTIQLLAENPDALGRSGELLLRALAKDGPAAYEALHFALEGEGRL